MGEFLGIALGSNLGNRIENFRAAVQAVKGFCEDDHLVTSSVFKTEPVDCPEGSEPFFNSVIEVICTLKPLEILERTQSIERDLGRMDKLEKNEPRPIDIDILYYGELTYNNRRDDLVIPHPSLKTRRFVIEPLSEIRPGLILPGDSQSIEEILADLSTTEPELKQIYQCGFWL